MSALAQSPDGQTVLVASGGAGKLTRLDAKLSVGKSFEVAPDPRAVLITRDGKTALVSHAGRPTLEVVDLATNQKEGEIALSLSPFDSAEDDPDAPASLSLRMKAALQETAPTPSEPGGRSAAQSYALVETSDPPGRVLLPHVLVDRGDQGSPQKFYGGHGTRHVPVVSVLDLAARRVVRPPGSFDAMMQFEEERFGPGRRNGSDRCLLPRSAAIDDATGTVLVGCAGVDSLVAYDARSVEPQAVERARFGVGTYPNGIAVDASARRAYVWGAHERVLDIVDIDAWYAGRLTKREKVQLERPRTPPSLGMMLGRQMFYASGDIRIASDGVACASCHPDGGDDGAVWITDGGPRRTKRLDVPRQGELLGWEGRHAGLGAFVEYEIEQLGGSGLRGVQLEALLTYVEQLRPAAAPGGEEAGALARHGCSACHAAAQGKAQDVGSRTRFDRRGEFLAPSRFGLAARGPYFHDGRFPTLESLLAAPHHERGKQMVLSEQDRADLLAALLAMRSGEAR